MLTVVETDSYAFKFSFHWIWKHNQTPHRSTRQEEHFRVSALAQKNFIALVPNILSDAQTQNNASMRCFVFSRLHLCSCQGSARLQIKPLIAQSLDLSPASYQPNHEFSLILGMTGSWDHPADIIQITPRRSSHFPFNGKWRLSSVSGG